MFKRITVLIMVLVFSLGFSFSLAEEKEAKRHRPHHMHGEMKAKMHGKDEELKKELNLTPEQGAKIKEIRQKSRDEAKAILEEAKAKIREIRVRANDEVKALLSAEQKEKFRELRKKHEGPPNIEEKE